MPPSLPARFIQRMEEVVAFSSQHVHDGGIPFTAFVVNTHGEILGRGVNHVVEHHDPTAHAEVEAIRHACRTIETPYLHGTTLLASGEPCAMCYLSAMFAGIDEVIFAVDRNDAAGAGFDYRDSYRMLANFPEAWPLKVSQYMTTKALEPFDLWRRKRHLL